MSMNSRTTGIVIKRGDLETGAWTQGECHVKMKADIYKLGNMRSLAKLQKLEEMNRTGSPTQPSEEANSADTVTLGFQPPEL